MAYNTQPTSSSRFVQAGGQMFAAKLDSPDDFREIGEVKIELTNDPTTTTFASNRSSSHSTAYKTTAQNWSFNAEIFNFSNENLAWFFGSLISTVTQTASTALTRDYRLYNGRYINIGSTGTLVMGDVDITLTSIVHKQSLSSTQWQASTSYAVGDVITPMAANNYVYICINAGDSDTTEPIFTSENKEFIDNAAVWRNCGKVVLSSDDYSIDNTDGMLYIKSGVYEYNNMLNISNTYTLTYDRANATRIKFNAGTASIERTIHIRTIDDTNNSNNKLYVIHRASITGDGGLTLADNGDDFLSFSVTGTALTPLNGASNALEIIAVNAS